MEIKVTPTFTRTFNNSHPIQLYRGGTRSGKSYAMMQRVVIWLLTGQINGTKVSKGRFSVTRSTLPALKATVLKDFESYLFELNVYQYIEHIKTTHEFKYRGREVVFFSLDDPHKLRGRNHDFIWINECTDTTFDTFVQANIRTRHTVYLDYNPSGSPYVKTEIEEKILVEEPERCSLDISVYTDNPFLPDRMVDEIKGLEKIDKDLFLIYTQGIWVTLKGLIYPNVRIIPDLPPVGKVYFGMDFGYNDPSVLVKVVIDKEDIFIHTLIHKSGLLLDEMAELCRKNTRQTDIIYCDSAEPRTIEELKRRGVNAKPAKKGRDSVRQTITFIKQHNVHVTETSLETIEEFKRFKWEEDKEGRLIDKPIDAFKHSSDAVGYAIHKALTQRISIL